MDVNLRAVVAYVAARHVTGQNTSCIRDKQQSAYVMLTGSIGADAVNIHDHQARCQIVGPRNEGRYELTHQGQGVQITIDFDGAKFTGRVNGETFRGEVQGRDVHVDEAGGRFEYSL